MLNLSSILMVGQRIIPDLTVLTHQALHRPAVPLTMAAFIAALASGCSSKSTTEREVIKDYDDPNQSEGTSSTTAEAQNDNENAPKVIQRNGQITPLSDVEADDRITEVQKTNVQMMYDQVVFTQMTPAKGSLDQNRADANKNLQAFKNTIAQVYSEGGLFKVRSFSYADRRFAEDLKGAFSRMNERFAKGIQIKQDVSSRYYLQFGSFSEEENANAAAKKAHEALKIDLVANEEAGRYTIVLGKETSKEYFADLIARNIITYQVPK